MLIKQLLIKKIYLFSLEILPTFHNCITVQNNFFSSTTVFNNFFYFYQNYFFLKRKVLKVQFVQNFLLSISQKKFFFSISICFVYDYKTNLWLWPNSSMREPVSNCGWSVNSSPVVILPLFFTNMLSPFLQFIILLCD